MLSPAQQQLLLLHAVEHGRQLYDAVRLWGFGVIAFARSGRVM